MSPTLLVLAGVLAGALLLFVVDRTIFRDHKKAPLVWPQWKQLRDILIFVGGMAFAAHEVFLREQSERPTILLLAATMMGLPLVLRADERRDKEAKGG